MGYFNSIYFYILIFSIPIITKQVLIIDIILIFRSTIPIDFMIFIKVENVTNFLQNENLLSIIFISFGSQYLSVHLQFD